MNIKIKVIPLINYLLFLSLFPIFSLIYSNWSWFYNPAIKKHTKATSCFYSCVSFFFFFSLQTLHAFPLPDSLISWMRVRSTTISNTLSDQNRRRRHLGQICRRFSSEHLPKCRPAYIQIPFPRHLPAAADLVLHKTVCTVWRILRSQTPNPHANHNLEYYFGKRQRLAVEKLWTTTMEAWCWSPFWDEFDM